MITKNCTKCGKEFAYEPVYVEDREVFAKTLCDDCIDAEEEDRAVMAQIAERVALHERWQRICPEEYRETDLERLNPTYRRAIERWSQASRKGIGIVGAPGLCKTRTAFLLLKKSHYEHRQACFAISAKGLAKCAIDQFDREQDVRQSARRKLALSRSADVLLLDDLGKGTMSERPEEELYDILEHRTSHRKLTIWTANSKGDALLNHFSPDRADAIFRRLTEFSEIV